MSGEVLGIGGVFFRARDPEALAAWYREELGVGWAGSDGWSWQTQGGPLVFAPFEAGTDHWAWDRQFMLNFRVSGLDGLIDRSTARGIEVSDS